MYRIFKFAEGGLIQSYYKTLSRILKLINFITLSNLSVGGISTDRR